MEELKGYIIEDSIVFIATSLGGGTGSAIAPMLAEILIDEGYTVGMIAVLPSDSESLKIKDNARQAFYEIEELKPRMGSIFILDNNATDKITVNKVFASLFSGVMCINNKSQDGNMDLAEIEACLKTAVLRAYFGAVSEMYPHSARFLCKGANLYKYSKKA